MKEVLITSGTSFEGYDIVEYGTLQVYADYPQL